MQAKEQIKITDQIAQFVMGLQFKDFSREILDIAKRSIADGIGVILAGSAEPSTEIVRNFARLVSGKEECTVFGKGNLKLAAHLAALVNAVSGHAMDWDDTAISGKPDKSVLLHPTLPPLVAGLAVAEKLSASGKDFLVAFMAGFEVECKIAEAIDADHRVRGFHTSGTCGVFGAAAAAARLMNLSADGVRNTLGLAASMAAGIGVQTGTMAKPLHVGRAAENGVVCAELASSGFQADPMALEGRKGFFQAYGGSFDRDVISKKLGQAFSILNPGVSLKPFPCGVVGQGGMDAMRTLVIENDVQAEMVEHVRVTSGSNILPPKGPLRYAKAQTALEAKFCVPFQMASMILRRKAGIREFTDEFVRNPAVQKMMDRIEAVVDPRLDAAGRNKYISRIEMKLKDGTILRASSPEYLPGSPRNPLSRSEIREKFADCAQEILNPDQADKILESVERLEEIVRMDIVAELASVS